MSNYLLQCISASYFMYINAIKIILFILFQLSVLKIFNVLVNFVLSANMAGRDSVTRNGRFTLFFKMCTFSQHARCTLHVDDHSFNSALHYMLYEKASEYIVLI